jgi:preprotein translocase subunit SecA
VACEVLNAKHDAAEAAIVARAGALGAITIATSMAGRGTDIRLGGEHEADRDQVAALGGLYVIGTSRHESRRVDLQLRGRAGRQGDPGESRFFVGLDDELLVRQGIARLIPRRWLAKGSDAPVENPIVHREVARAQRIADGQNLEIRRTLARYAAIVEEQHRRLMEWRSAILTGDEPPGIWERAPGRRAALAAAAGEPAVVDAERAATLRCIDRAWRDHLALCADLREGIHLVRLGGEDPLTRFASEAIRAFSGIEGAIEEAVLGVLDSARAAGGRIDLTASGITAPSATWTYLVNDDPFRDRIGAMLTGPGRATIAIYAAAVLMPLLILWGLAEKLLRAARRRSRPLD